MQFELLSQDKKKVGTVELSDHVFGVTINIPLVHQVIKAQLAGRRQGTAKTKTKGEIRGGGRKPFKQKGTGNARQGSTRSPLRWVVVRTLVRSRAPMSRPPLKR